MQGEGPRQQMALCCWHRAWPSAPSKLSARRPKTALPAATTTQQFARYRHISSMASTHSILLLAAGERIAEQTAGRHATSRTPTARLSRAPRASLHDETRQWPHRYPVMIDCPGSDDGCQVRNVRSEDLRHRSSHTTEAFCPPAHPKLDMTATRSVIQNWHALWLVADPQRHATNIISCTKRRTDTVQSCRRPCLRALRPTLSLSATDTVSNVA